MQPASARRQASNRSSTRLRSPARRPCASSSTFDVRMPTTAPDAATPAPGERSIPRAVFVDASPSLADLAEELAQTSAVALTVNRQPDIRSEALPATLAGATIAVIDHTYLPTA